MKGKGKYFVDIKTRFKKFKESVFKQYKNDYIGDAFYFPQIIWAAFLLSCVSVGYIFYSFSSTVLNLQSS